MGTAVEGGMSMENKTIGEILKDFRQTAKIVEDEYATVMQCKWIFHDNGDATCNQCGRRQKAIWDDDGWQNFCGNCGADMREVQNE